MNSVGGYRALDRWSCDTTPSFPGLYPTGVDAGMHRVPRVMWPGRDKDAQPRISFVERPREYQKLAGVEHRLRNR